MLRVTSTTTGRYLIDASRRFAEITRGHKQLLPLTSQTAMSEPSTRGQENILSKKNANSFPFPYCFIIASGTVLFKWRDTVDATDAPCGIWGAQSWPGRITRQCLCNEQCQKPFPGYLILLQYAFDGRYSDWPIRGNGTQTGHRPGNGWTHEHNVTDNPDRAKPLAIVGGLSIWNTDVS